MGIQDFLTHFVGGTEYYYGFTERIVLEATGILFPPCAVQHSSSFLNGDYKPVLQASLSYTEAGHDGSL
jgi:hypothetical protein